MKKVLIPTKLDHVAKETLEANGDYRVVQDESGGLAALAQEHPDTYALIVRSNKVTAEVIDALPSLAVIVRAGAGFNTIDTKYARAKGIDLGFEDVETYVRDFGMNIPNSFPSMQQDHAAGRKSEIDAINGIVPVQAATVGLEAPMNLTVASIIRARESLFD